MAPKVVIDLSGGLIQSIVSEIELEVAVIDYDDVDTHGGGRIVTIDGQNLAYVFAGIGVEVDPARTQGLFSQIRKDEDDE